MAAIASAVPIVVLATLTSPVKTNQETKMAAINKMSLTGIANCLAQRN
jgi:hypothetical protein